MIFVTVGTHEQGLDRLLIELDNLIEMGKITYEIFAQIGYSTYKPKNYKYKDMIEYDEMDEWIKKSDIVITHGGPGSIFHAIQYGKIPIVVPRNPRFNEHVDDHQILFTKRLENENKVIGVYDIKEIEACINNYEKNRKKCKINISNMNSYIGRFDNLIKLSLIK